MPTSSESACCVSPRSLRNETRRSWKFSSAGSVPGEWGGPGEIQGVEIDTGILNDPIRGHDPASVAVYGWPDYISYSYVMYFMWETDRGWNR